MKETNLPKIVLSKKYNNTIVGPEILDTEEKER